MLFLAEFTQPHTWTKIVFINEDNASLFKCSAQVHKGSPLRRSCNALKIDERSF